ncbi:TetR/AcrR family transcriptional regulator [Leisingera caerulea]|uniref:TetR/AcrR family transcriptional regulator n=1 Tax=Leisingera caerulea TaxID=506591 RepID=UPI0021A686AA|nr:TetR/AcrR family transcriptional regulator [Leisingera caerulea]UWQ62096.1 TetR/AcrR family transcriptional regulator [Leisingera caerulea]
MRPNKRDELIRRALDLFYGNGFHATGMDLVAAETGVSKTSIYKHFRSKEELILAVLRLRDEDFRSWLYGRLEARADTPRGQLEALFDVLEEWFGQPGFQGCMFIKASAEYQSPEDPINVQSAEHKRLLQEHFARLAAEAGAREPVTLARQLMVLKEGAIVLAALTHGSAPARDARTAAAALIEQAIA